MNETLYTKLIRLLSIRKILLSCISIIFILLMSYLAWMTFLFCRAKEEVNGLQRDVEVIKKFMFLRDLGLPLGGQYDTPDIVRRVREMLYVKNYTVNSFEKFTGKYKDVMIKYNLIIGNKNCFSCGDLSQVYGWVLKSFHIPFRFVQLAAKTYVDGKKNKDTHVYVEIFDGSKWFVSDPTFNAEYYCSDGKGPLSTKEMKVCLSEQKKIIPHYGKTVLPNRTLEAYGLPLEKLLYAYVLWRTKIKDEIIPKEEYPFRGWFGPSTKKYKK